LNLAIGLLRYFFFILLNAITSRSSLRTSRPILGFSL
jgi:hypothetical protein